MIPSKIASWCIVVPFKALIWDYLSPHWEDSLSLRQEKGEPVRLERKRRDCGLRFASMIEYSVRIIRFGSYKLGGVVFSLVGSCHMVTFNQDDLSTLINPSKDAVSHMEAASLPVGNSS